MSEFQVPLVIDFPDLELGPAFRDSILLSFPELACRTIGYHDNQISQPGSSISILSHPMLAFVFYEKEKGMDKETMLNLFWETSTPEDVTDYLFWEKAGTIPSSELRASFEKYQKNPVKIDKKTFISSDTPWVLFLPGHQEDAAIQKALLTIEQQNAISAFHAQSVLSVLKKNIDLSLASMPRPYLCGQKIGYNRLENKTLVMVSVGKKNFTPKQIISHFQQNPGLGVDWLYFCLEHRGHPVTQKVIEATHQQVLFEGMSTNIPFAKSAASGKGSRPKAIW